MKTQLEKKQLTKTQNDNDQLQVVEEIRTELDIPNVVDGEILTFTEEFATFEKEGDSIIGYYQGIHPITIKKDTPNEQTFEVAKVLTSTSMKLFRNHIVLKTLSNQPIGTLVMITYAGKRTFKDINGAVKTVNLYNIIKPTI